MNVALVLFCAAIFLFIGGLLLFIAIRTKRKALLSEDWPAVDGLVISSTLQEYAHLESEKGRAVHIYEPQVTYQYSVDAQPFSSNRISAGVSRFDKRTAEKILKRYPPGTKVHVHYNPLEPQESVLETIPIGNNLTIALSIIFLVIGVGIVVFAILQDFFVHLKIQ